MNNPLYIVKVASIGGENGHIDVHNHGPNARHHHVMYCVARPDRNGVLKFDAWGFGSRQELTDYLDEFYGVGGWTNAALPEEVLVPEPATPNDYVAFRLGRE
jgi:hypothetical protein